MRTLNPQSDRLSLSMVSIQFSFTLILAFLLNVTTGLSQIISVTPGNSIQAAIDQAVDGDTILVDQGTYEGSLVIGDKAIVLASQFLRTEDEFDKENTIIIGDTENTISFKDGSKSLLIGFTIKNTNTRNGLERVILCDTSSPLIVNNIIRDGSAKGFPLITKQYGGGIFVKKGSPVIASNRIIGNYAWQFGGAIAVWYGAPLITHNIIADNKATRAGAIYCFKSTAKIIGNIIDSNTSEQAPGGGGIILEEGFDEVLFNTIVNNHNENNAGKGAGLLVEPNSFSKIKYNIIAKNSTPSDGRGAGLYCSDLDSVAICPNSIIPDTSNTIIQHNFFFDNIRENAFAADDIFLVGNFDTLNNRFLVDPLFVDFDNQDYELQPGSPAIGLGHSGISTYAVDFDKDGRTDWEEITMDPITNPLIPDTDGDGVLDWEEIYVYDTQPLVEDSDGDSHHDGFEIQIGTNPNDPTDFPVTLQRINFDTLTSRAKTLSQLSFSIDTIPSVPILDFPKYGQENEVGLVFNELDSIQLDNPLDSGFLFFPVRPRGSLDSVPIVVYTDHDNDHFFDIVKYENLDVSYQGMCPPIDEALIPVAGKTLSRFEIGAEQDNSSFPTLATFSATTYARLLPYVGVDEQFYGVSHRAATHFLGDSAVDEKFPRFKEVYLNIIDSASARAMTIVDGEAFSGATSYTFKPGEVSEMKVKAHFFARDNLQKNTFGVLGMSSMFWKGERGTTANEMDEAHDSDMIIVGYDRNSDGIVDFVRERPLANPGVCNATTVVDFDTVGQGNQVYFALEQRDRNPLHYDDFRIANYHLRPSYSVSLIYSNVPLSLKLFEFGTDGEFFDNIALAFVVKDIDIPVGDSIIIEYVLNAYFPNDTDQDGLNDHLERLIGTCLDQTDTDGDDRSDYEELINGENPRTDLSYGVDPSSLTFNVNRGDSIQGVIRLLDSLSYSCSTAMPILGIGLQDGTAFSIVDTLGNFSKCPYLLAEDGSLDLVIAFTSPTKGSFFDTLVITLMDSTFYIPLFADVIPNVEQIDNQQSVNVFPNPSNGEVTIYLEGWVGEVLVQVIDLQGRVIRKTLQNSVGLQRFEFQMNKIPKGYYLLEVSNLNYQITKKLTIN